MSGKSRSRSLPVNHLTYHPIKNCLVLPTSAMPNRNQTILLPLLKGAEEIYLITSWLEPIGNFQIHNFVKKFWEPKVIFGKWFLCSKISKIVCYISKISENMCCGYAIYFEWGGVSVVGV